MTLPVFARSVISGVQNIPREFFYFGKNSLNYLGRERRGPFLRFYLTLIILLSMMQSLALSGHASMFWQLFLPLFLVFSLLAMSSAMSRRMRDAGFSPWILLAPVLALPAGAVYGSFFSPNEWVNIGFLVYILGSTSVCTLMLLAPSRKIPDADKKNETA